MAIILDKKRKEGLVLTPTSSDRKLARGLKVTRNKKRSGNSLEKIIEKPWGFEFLCYMNEYLDIWQFHLNPKASTSFHCHPGKDALKIVLEGKIMLETIRGKEILSTGDVKLIKGFTLHRTSNIGIEIARVLEIESPPDKENLIRVDDFYGRRKLPYIFKMLENHATKDILVNSFFRENKKKISQNIEAFYLSSAKPFYKKNKRSKEIMGLHLKKDAKCIKIRTLPLGSPKNVKKFFIVLKGMLSIEGREGLREMFPGDCCAISSIKSLSVPLESTKVLIW
jgi:mannose-6-phosphate isomerase-like protein (cupin superfamily)